VGRPAGAIIVLMRRGHGIQFLAVGLAVFVAACGSSASTQSSAPVPASASAPPTVAAQTPSPVSTSTGVTATLTTANGATDAYPLVAAYQGHFTGSWNDSTFGTTGSMVWDISADPSARTVDITVDVGGHFFGGSGGPPESIKLTHLAQGVINGNSAAFGDVSGTIAPDGTLTITLTNIPGGVISKVEIMGTFTGGNTISMSYTVDFVAGSGAASGTVKLNRG
jgi:hypothetical protein